MHIPPEIIAGVSAGVAVLLLLLVIYRYLLRICRPNEILIFSGRKHVTDDGRTVGYRVVFGGRGMRVPVVETVQRMDVSLISVPIAVQGAYSEGGIPLTVHAIANIKVSRGSCSCFPCARPTSRCSRACRRPGCFVMAGRSEA